MALAQLLQVATLLAYGHAGAHADWQLQGREQVRVGLINTPGTGQTNTLSFAEIAMASGQVHATFGNKQDLLIRYQPRLLDSLRSTLAIPGLPSQTLWTGLSVLHRALLTYKAGEEHVLAFDGQVNISIGKLDTGNPEAEVVNSGFLPGAIGTLVNYSNMNAIFKFTHRPHRSIRLMTQETLGMIQYQVNPASAFFNAMPALKAPKGQALETQLRLFVKGELEYLVNAKHSLFADIDLTDVSYQDTASFPAFAPTVGWGTQFGGASSLKIQAGFIKYWVNPLPGIYEKPGYLPSASLTWAQSFSRWHLPNLRANLVLSILPYYNLLFDSLEPRSTINFMLAYKANRQLSLLANFRVLSSRFYNFKGWRHLQRGHQRDVLLGSVGVRYNWRNILEFSASVYGSNYTYQASASLPYTQMRQFYTMLSLQGTWQTGRQRAGQSS